MQIAAEKHDLRDSPDPEHLRIADVPVQAVLRLEDWDSGALLPDWQSKYPSASGSGPGRRKS